MKRGPKPKGLVVRKWSPKLAYAIGLITADGCLSKDGRHIDLTSTDMAQIVLFQKCLGIENKISIKKSGAGNPSFRTQFGDVLFYNFLLMIGLTPAKSNTLSSLIVPKKYFMDFFRGYFDGDGSSCSYYDPTYVNSFRFYLSFTSGSQKYLDWLRSQLKDSLGVKGYFSYNRNTPYVQLKYSKNEASTICKSMYYNEDIPCLKRKRTKVFRALEIIG